MYSYNSIDNMTDIRRGFKERRTGRTPPPSPLKFSMIRVLGDIYIYIITNVHISRSILMSLTIIFLPLISDFISIMPTLLGSYDL